MSLIEQMKLNKLIEQSKWANMVSYNFLLFYFSFWWEEWSSFQFP